VRDGAVVLHIGCRMTARRNPSERKPESRRTLPAATAATRLERIAAFSDARFVRSVVDEEGLPEMTGVEIAFVGRSNSGKSSSINKFVGQTKLAYASKMPGRTRELNFFALRGGGYLVDLPGYGFARTPRDKQRVWTGMIEMYLRTRTALRGIVLLSDVRHAPSDLDIEFVSWLNRENESEIPRPPILWLLNKADKLTQSERMKIEREARSKMAEYLRENDHLILFSAHSGLGMKHCATVFDSWLTAAPDATATAIASPDAISATTDDSQ
jgi:GTP-binding protein